MGKNPTPGIKGPRCPRGRCDTPLSHPAPNVARVGFHPIVPRPARRYDPAAMVNRSRPGKRLDEDLHHPSAMKTIIILTILIASALTFLTSCRTWPEPARPVRGKASPRGLPAPYYRSDSEGSYYYLHGDAADANRNYRPAVTRNLR